MYLRDILRTCPGFLTWPASWPGCGNFHRERNVSHHICNSNTQTFHRWVSEAKPGRRSQTQVIQVSHHGVSYISICRRQHFTSFNWGSIGLWYFVSFTYAYTTACSPPRHQFPLITIRLVLFTHFALPFASFPIQFSSVQSLSRVRLFATPWIAARQASLSITTSRSSLRPTSFESAMPSSHLILCRPLFLLPPIPPSIRVFSNESVLCMRWPKYWS